MRGLDPACVRSHRRTVGLRDLLARLLAVGLIAAGSNPVPAATLLQWDIPVSASAAAGTTSVAAPTNGSGISGISGTVISVNGSVAGTTSSSGWRWYDPSPFATDLSTALSGTNYFSWTITTNGVTTATVNGLGSTFFSKGSTAPNSLALLYSTDPAFVTYRTVSGSTAIPSTTTTDLSSGLAGDLSTTAIVMNPSTTGYFRLAYWGATTVGSGAIWTGSASTTNDFSLLGSASSSVVARTLTWDGVAGAPGSTWNTTQANTVWLESGTTTFFNEGDSAVFAAASNVVVDAAGVSSGSVTVSHSSGTVALSGGSLTASSLLKSGAGTLTLSASNAFQTGGTVSGGTVEITTPAALGTAAITFNGGSLAASGSVTSVSTPFGVGTGGMTVANDSALTLTALITGGSSTRFTKTGSGNLSLTGVVGTQTSAPLEMDLSSGTTTLSGGQKNVGGPAVTNDWNGSVVLGGGTLMLHGGTVSGSGTITNENGSSAIVSRLNVGPVTVANDIVLNQLLTGSAPSGNNKLTFTGAISGTAGLSLPGNGTKQFDGVNTYQGPTTITAGVTRINGSLTNASTVTVAGPATLSGSGSVNSTTTVQNLGVLSPNVPEGAARLTFGNGLTLNAGASTTWNLFANTDAAGDAGTLLGYSQVAVTGGNLTVTSGATINLVFSGSGSTVLWSDPFWNTSRSWTIVDYSGSGSESLANYTISNVSFVDSGTQALDTVTRGSFSVSNNGQDMFLNFSAVPEPASAVLAGFGFLAAAAAVRRRRVKQRRPDAVTDERRSD
jgi:fibronectin-binding autotransporter adhesin